MYKRVWMGLFLLLLTPALLTTVSCRKKISSAESMTGPGAEGSRDGQGMTDEERRLREEALREEQMRKTQSAREQFENEDVYFEYDSSVLTSEARELLKLKAEWMEANPGVSAVIEGHCDKRGTNEYNLALGDRRAESAKAFMANLGISNSRLSTVSYGEEKPLDDGDSEAAYTRNRRVHFVLR